MYPASSLVDLQEVLPDVHVGYNLSDLQTESVDGAVECSPRPVSGHVVQHLDSRRSSRDTVKDPLVLGINDV